MPQRQSKGYPKDASTPPQKKVTFYGPVMTTKAEKLRYVGTKAAPRKRTNLSSHTSTANGIITQPLHHKQSKSVGSEHNKPHSKTTVIGIPTMTRLHCNHLRPKCQCSSIYGKKMRNKVKYKPAVSDTPRQILTSTRSLPRGELNGRKSYKENSNSVSILDANWTPGSDVYYKDTLEGLSTNQNFETDVNKENIENNEENKESSKKKVQFAEEMNGKSGSRKKLDVPQSGNHLNVPREVNYSQRYNKDNRGHPVSQPNSHSTEPESSRKVLDPPVGPSTSYHPQISDVFNDSSLTDGQEGAARKNYCKLCELSDRRFPKTFLYNEINYNSDDHRDEEYSSTHYPGYVRHSSEYENEDPCLLCRRYRRQHYYTDGKDQHKKYDADYSHTCTDLNEDTRSPFHKTRSPLHRKLSTPMLYSDTKEESVFTRRIPYEPRTELVKNLKQKLEAEYRKDKYLLRRNNFRRRCRSWDAEDLDLHHSHLHNYNMAWDHNSRHKCIHRYLQNDRLFLEPTVMDVEGQSVCVECRKPQPTDPEQDPFLYHITLGEMDKSGLGQNKDEKAWRYQSRLGFTSKKADKHTNHQKSEKGSDTSKHIFARLNKNISNIFPSGSGYSLHPRAASKLRYFDPHVKRHPSKSMALVDHIV